MHKLARQKILPVPLINHMLTPNRAWGLWQITEKMEYLKQQFPSYDRLPAGLNHPDKICEHMVGRILIRKLCRHLQLPYEGIRKNENNKPFLYNQPVHISISHSHPYVTAVIDRINPVGIDLEQYKPKLLRIAPRILHASEVADAGTDISKHTVYWCAKEALLKVQGEKNLTFAEDIRITPFTLQNRGILEGHILRPEKISIFNLEYQLMPDYAYAYTL